MSRATEQEFDELHGLTCRMLLRMLKAADAGRLKNEDGDYIMPPPSLLAQAIKFLQANGIDRPASSRERVDTLKDEMPDLDEIERGTVVPFRK